MIRGYSTHVEWSKVDAAYVATCPEFPGLVGANEDAGEAIAELREAMEMALEVLEEDGEPLPERKEIVEHSGQFRLRLPKSLHASLARRADEENVSLNSHILTVLACAIGEAKSQTEVASDLRDLLQALRLERAEIHAALASRSATSKDRLPQSSLADDRRPAANSRHLALG